MGLIEDIRKEFIDPVSGEHILVFITPEVDSVCSSRILRHICRHSMLLYSIIIVSNKEELRQRFAENKENFTYVLLVNCGANFDILEDLDAPESTIFFICDSHRPIHVKNYYNQRQVKLITLNERTEDIPKFEDIFREESSDESEESEDDDGEDVTSAAEKRHRRNLRRAEKQINRRKWERRREEILLEYESFSYYATATSIVLFDVAWKQSLDNFTLLWCAIVGHISQAMLYKINRAHYLDQIENLHSHVTRLLHATNQAGGNNRKSSVNPNGNSRKDSITFTEELVLWLYRHWSLKESMETTMLTSTRFKLFTKEGRSQMQDFLAHIGISQRDCAQKYSILSLEVRDNLDSLFANAAERYGFRRKELFLPSFTLQLVYKTPLSAMDVFWLILSGLECQNKSPSECFHAAGDMLNTNWTTESLEKWMSDVQAQLRLLIQQVRALHDAEEVVGFGPFLYVYIARSSLQSLAFRNPQFALLTARYLLTMKAAFCPKMGRKRIVKKMPLVLCVDSTTEENHIFLVGIPPLQGEDDRNLFGQAFAAAVRSSGARAKLKHFDTNCVELHRQDMLKFFEALSSLLSD
nr:cell division control protein 45 [Hymenolepis microstoma]